MAGLDAKTKESIMKLMKYIETDVQVYDKVKRMVDVATRS
jgi:hypothetical protein